MGCIEGCVVGKQDGWVDGEIDGCIEGFDVGCKEGWEDGWSDGWSVGCTFKRRRIINLYKHISWKKKINLKKYDKWFRMRKVGVERMDIFYYAINKMKFKTKNKKQKTN